MALLRGVSRPTAWPIGALLVGVVACYSEPDALSNDSDGSSGGTASDAGPTSSATTPTGDGPVGPGSNTQGGTGDDTTAGDPDTSPPDTDTSPGSGSTDDGPADTGSTGEPAACSSGPLSFTWSEAPAIATQPNPQGLAGALIDGDDFLDIAVSSYDTQSVSIYLGDGAGGFTLGTQVFAPGNASSVALAPIADDTPDLFVEYYNVATFQSNMQRWRGDGSGNFQFATSLGAVGEIGMGNFNGDAYLDLALVTSTNPPSLEMRAGDVTESFGPPVNIGPYTGRPLVGDLDGDGDDDIAAVGGTLATLLVNDNGVFSSVAEVALGAPIGAAVLGDPTGDGNLDLVTGTLGGGNTIAQIFPGTGTGQLGAALLFPISNYTAYAASKDFDADGVDDVLLVANSGALTFMHSEGDGDLSSTEVTAADGCLNARGLVVEDINDDCVPDPILVCSSGEAEEVRIFLSQI